MRNRLIHESVEDSANTAKSRGNNPFGDDSVSIENQKIILRKYAEANNWIVRKIYSDDGYSGGNFRRPGFAEMLEDAENKMIDLIIVKDLSRLGREYVDVGYYTEELFPSLGVRFIALTDDIDSEKNTDILPFRSFLNAYYIKDLSRKVKSVLQAKAKSGEYASGSVAYGYIKNAENPHRLAADRYAAEIVKRIFDLRLKNNSCRKIAAVLNKNGVLSPRTYYYEKTGRYNPYSTDFKWSERTVKLILQNEVYIGNTVQMKSGTLSYKNKKRVSKPTESRIRVENTHPLIISRDIWDAVQLLNSAQHYPSERKPPEKSLFSGLIICSDCGRPLTSTVTNKRRNGRIFKYTSYFCSYFKRTGGTQCSRHSISEQMLLQLIHADIQSQLDKVDIDETRVIAAIQDDLSKTSINETRISLQKLSAKLIKSEDMNTKLYEDRLNGIISIETYKRLSVEAEKEQYEIQSEIDRLTAVVETSEQKIAGIESWVSNMRSYLALEKIDREMLCLLVDKIIVDERGGNDKGINGQRNIKIIYRF